MDMKSIIQKMDQLSQVDEAKPDFLDLDKDGDKKEPMSKAAKEKGKDKEDKEKVDEAIAIQADGQEAMALLDMLKLAGRPAPQPVTVGGCGMGEERDPAYANTPDEEISSMDAATPSGNDLHKSKTMTKHGYQQGDNPLAMAEVAAMEGKLAKMFESLSKEDDEDDDDEWYDAKGKRSKSGAYDAGGHYHADRDADKVKATFSSKKK